MSRHALRGWTAAALLALLAGCGPGPERFVPAEEKARQALETALTAWQHGEPRGPVAGTTAPVVQFVDSHHKTGRRLRSFAVLGLAPGSGPRVFTVKLSLDGPEQEVRERYVVMGLDPLWVLHEEDFDMLAHWEHHMTAPATGTP